MVLSKASISKITLEYIIISISTLTMQQTQKTIARQFQPSQQFLHAVQKI